MRFLTKPKSPGGGGHPGTRGAGPGFGYSLPKFDQFWPFLAISAKLSLMFGLFYSFSGIFV